VNGLGLLCAKEDALGVRAVSPVSDTACATLALLLLVRTDLFAGFAYHQH